MKAKKPLGTPARERPWLGPEGQHAHRDGHWEEIVPSETHLQQARVSLQGVEVLWRLELSAPEIHTTFVGGCLATDNRGFPTVDKRSIFFPRW